MPSTTSDRTAQKRIRFDAAAGFRAVRSVLLTRSGFKKWLLVSRQCNSLRSRVSRMECNNFQIRIRGVQVGKPVETREPSGSVLRQTINPVRFEGLCSHLLRRNRLVTARAASAAAASSMASGSGTRVIVAEYEYVASKSKNEITDPTGVGPSAVTLNNDMLPSKVASTPPTWNRLPSGLALRHPKTRPR